MEFGNGCKLIVGVDYGTTSTGMVEWVHFLSSHTKLNIAQIGVSYALAGNSQHEIIPIANWPQNRSGLKAPSQVTYAGSHGQSLWGFEIHPGMQTFSWTKLLLDPTLDRDDFQVETLEVASALGILKLPEDRNAEEVVTDFLRHVYRHVYDLLMENLPRVMMSLDSVPIEFWVTFPATWSEVAQSRLIRAASNAGFGSRNSDRIFTVSEPEAAALAVLHLSDEFKLKVSWSA